jgi:hypothetical protein
MFWDLKGATFRPRLERERQRAATRVLLPEWDVVPRTTMNLLKDILPLMPLLRWRYICFEMVLINFIIDIIAYEDLFHMLKLKMLN